MSLLLQTKILYRSFRMERPATDAAVLQLRDFLTLHFGHEGTQAWQEVDGTTHTKQAADKPGGKVLRRFQHPLATPRPAATKKQATPLPVADAGGPVDPNADDELSAQQNTAGVRLEDGTVVPLGMEPAADETSGDGGADAGKSPVEVLSENRPSISPESNTGPVVDSLLIDLGEVSDQKPKAAAATYGRERLVATLVNHNVEFNSNGSDTQLAAALIQYAKTTA